MTDSNKVLVEKIVIAALLVALVVSVVRAKKPFRKKGPVSQPKNSTAFNIDSARTRLAGAASWRRAEYKEEPVRDPFRKPDDILRIGGRDLQAQSRAQPETDAGAKLKLEGVIWDGRENLAIISGNVVSVGEVVEKAKVVSITRDGVKLIKGGSEIELKR